MTVQDRKSIWSRVNIIYIVGCVLLTIAGFLPYIYIENQNMTLMEGVDGIFFLVFSILILIFISFEKEKIVGILSLLTVYLGAYELVHTYGVMTNNGHSFSLRPGYYVLLIGTLVLLVGVAEFIYRCGLKNLLNKIFDRIFPINSEKHE